MIKTESSFLSHDGVTPIHTVEWLPEGGVLAVFQISHGVSEYIDRYAPLAEFLTDRGFAVAGSDHLGHGASVAPGGKPLYFGERDGWNTVVDDLESVRADAARRHPGAPHVLLGHSMGSFLVRTYLIRYPGTVDAAILMGTGQMSPLLTAGGRAVALREARKVGPANPSPVVTKLAFGSYNKPFAPNRTAFDWLSVNRENVDAYIADPLCGGNASIGLFRDLLGGMDFNRRPENLKSMNANTPVLFVSGSLDPVGDAGKGVVRAYRSFRRAGMRDVSMKLYPGARHEILNDDCRDTVREDLYRWMLSRLEIPEPSPAQA